MGDWFLGEIRIFPFNWAPKGWALCDGSVIPIRQSQALFSLIGNHYGGDGKTNFALPSLRGRTPINKGQQTGDPNRYQIGDKGGAEAVTVTAPPQHAHSVVGYSRDGDLNVAQNGYPVQAIADASNNIPNLYGRFTPGQQVPLHPKSVGASGGGKAHDNMEPYTVLNFCIATTGLYPPRP